METNEWTKEENELLVIGITKTACQSIGEIVYVELPQIGTHLNKDDVLLVLESTKAAVDIYMPCSGRVMFVNEILYKEPDLINRDPEKAGWLVKIQKDKESSNEI